MHPNGWTPIKSGCSTLPAGDNFHNAPNETIQAEIFIIKNRTYARHVRCLHPAALLRDLTY
jgi:hypothetical protein